MPNLIDGRAIAEKVYKSLRNEISELKNSGVVPGLAVVLVVAELTTKLSSTARFTTPAVVVLAAYKAAERAGLDTAECYCAGVEAWRRSHPDQTQTYSAKQAVAIIQATRIRLAPSDPTIAPTVLAAYTPPTSRAGSWPRAATDARARGKLAPQRIAAGKTVHSDRTISNCIVNIAVFEIDGSMGQYGSDSVSIYAAHAIAAHSRTWHHANATRGLFSW